MKKVKDMSDDEIKEIITSTEFKKDFTDDMTKEFVAFIKGRFPTEWDKGYLKNWVRRFAKKMHMVILMVQVVKL